jgi:hypothetical protein
MKKKRLVIFQKRELPGTRASNAHINMFVTIKERVILKHTLI